MDNTVTIEFEIEPGEYTAIAGGNRTVFEYQGNQIAAFSLDYVKGVAISDTVTVRSSYIESKTLGLIHRVSVLSR